MSSGNVTHVWYLRCTSGDKRVIRWLKYLQRTGWEHINLQTIRADSRHEALSSSDFLWRGRYCIELICTVKSHTCSYDRCYCTNYLFFANSLLWLLFLQLRLHWRKMARLSEGMSVWGILYPTKFLSSLGTTSVAGLLCPMSGCSLLHTVKQSKKDDTLKTIHSVWS